MAEIAILQLPIWGVYVVQKQNRQVWIQITICGEKGPTQVRQL